jgi:hypothetical protein
MRETKTREIGAGEVRAGKAGAREAREVGAGEVGIRKDT